MYGYVWCTWYRSSFGVIDAALGSVGRQAVTFGREEPLAGPTRADCSYAAFRDFLEFRPMGYGPVRDVDFRTGVWGGDGS